MHLSAIDRMVLSQYSPIEKESIYQVVCAAMVIDGERDPRELRLVEEIVGIIGLTPLEREDSRRLDEPTMTRTIQNMSVIKRAYVAKLIAQMILADGKVAEREELLFNFFISKFNLPQDPDNL